MKQFLKFVLATIIGLILFIGLGLLIVASSVQSIGKEKEVVIKEKSILHLKLNYAIPDRTSDNPFEKLAQLSGDMSSPLGLYDIVGQIDRASDDSKIKGIFMDLTAVGAGFGKTLELRNALNEFKESGKFVYAYAENYDNKSYYLASVADKVYINPKGLLFFNGLRGSVTFMKEMLSKVGVEMQVIKRGKFKGAVEPFVLNTLSKENRAQIDAYVNSIFDVMLSSISESRNISVDSLKSIADRLDVRNSETAVSFGLIDKMAFRDEVIADLKAASETEEDDKVQFVKLGKYFKNYKASAGGDKKIAIVFAEGSIVSGSGEEGQIGSDVFAKALKSARENEDVAAVVLRVNSPGGSALASEIILREAELLNAEKPLIVSMGDVAASGGYYISCLSDSIVAQPNTITGSIGVFGLVPNAEGMMEKLGLHSEYVGTGAYSDFGRIDRPLNEGELNIIDQYVGEIYDDFLSHVSEGRGMTVAEVDSIGQGRVWTGTMAMNLGLVDVIGGLDKALEIAAYKADLDDYNVKSYPKLKNPIEELMKAFSMSSVSQKLIKTELGDNYQMYKAAKDVQNMDGVQAILPYQINIK